MQLSLEPRGDELVVTASGRWGLSSFYGKRRLSPEAAVVAEQTARAEAMLGQGGVRALVFRADQLESWDSSLLSVLRRLAACARKNGAEPRLDQLPQGLARLMQLALAVPPAESSTRRAGYGPLWLLGDWTVQTVQGLGRGVTFLGEVTAALGRFFIGRSACSSRDLWQAFLECGAAALPIVALTSLLLGLIFAFVGAIQLKLFGAQIYVAALVAVAMVRVMGPVLTGIVLSGRTGASFAAIIGSMQVNEEVDALVAFGISPVDFLVLPRVLALTLMTPLLTVYADIMGIVGGFLVGTLMLGISPMAYWENTLQSLSYAHIGLGLLHALVFGVVVSLSGCYQGMRCGRSAEGVGRATTASVVNAIVGIIVSTSVITLITTAIGI